MAADVAASMQLLSTTESANAPLGTTAISTNLDDNLRQIQVIIRYLASSSTIASATTPDIGGNFASFLTVTGTTTITGLGTVAAGIWRVLVFSGALTLTHNASSLILPGAASITTAAGDCALMLSLGSGNWRCIFYSKASGQAIVPVSGFADGTVAAPGLYLTTDTDTGFYKIGADSLGLAVGGVKVAEFSTTNGLLVAGKSTLGPLQIAAADAVIFEMNGQNFTINDWGTLDINGSATAGGQIEINAGQGGSLSLGGGTSSDGTGGGDAQLFGGTETAGSAAGGSLRLSAGRNSSTNVGSDVTISLPGTTTPGNLVFESADASAAASFLKIVGSSKHWHVMDPSAANTPAVTAGGGTGPSVAGTDNAFQVTIGSGGTASTVTVTFKRAWASAPMVIASHQGAPLALKCVATTTTVVITALSAFTASGLIDVICIGRET